MKIFAVIVTYNAMHRQWIDRCLNSLAESTVPVVPIVIDNASTDGTRDHVPANYLDVVWLPQQKNLGFGQANNIGIRYALEHDADYVLLLNQDAAISPDAIERMLAVSDGESLLSPLHLNGDGTRIDEMFRYSLRNSVNVLLDDLLVRASLSDCYMSAEICAACWLLPVALIRKIGGFNPLFFHYSEDNNYYHRMTYHGIKIILVPKAKMYHDRLLQGNIQAFNHLRLRRDVLLVAANINLSFGKRCHRWMKILYHNYACNLPRHNYLPGAWLKEMFWLLWHTRQIRGSRRTERELGMAWLSPRHE